MPDREVLRQLHDEGRQTLERQMKTGEDLDTKASQLLRFDALLIGIVLSAMAISLRAPVSVGLVPAWIVASAAGGLGLIGLSTLGALTAYEVTQYGIGMRARSLRQVLDDEPDHDPFLERLVHTYADVVEGNRDPLDQTAKRLKYALWTLLGGLVLLGAAAGGFLYVAV